MTDPQDPQDPAEPPDLDALAKRYLDMWQAQVNAMAGDGEAAKTLAGTMAMMSAGAQAFADAARQTADQAATKAGGDDRAETAGAETDADGPRGAADAADAASGGASELVERLLERLGAVEERVAGLESELARLGRRVGGDDHDDKS